MLSDVLLLVGVAFVIAAAWVVLSLLFDANTFIKNHEGDEYDPGSAINGTVDKEPPDKNNRGNTL